MRLVANCYIRLPLPLGLPFVLLLLLLVACRMRQFVSVLVLASFAAALQFISDESIKTIRHVRDEVSQKHTERLIRD